MYQVSPINWLIYMYMLIFNLNFLFVFLKKEKFMYMNKYYIKMLYVK